jgi:hypothetical protein
MEWGEEEKQIRLPIGKRIREKSNKKCQSTRMMVIKACKARPQCA